MPGFEAHRFVERSAIFYSEMNWSYFSLVRARRDCSSGAAARHSLSVGPMLDVDRTVGWLVGCWIDRLVAPMSVAGWSVDCYVGRLVG